MSSGAIRAASAFIELSLQDKIRLGLNRVTRNFRQFAANLEQIGARITAITITPVIGIGQAIATFAEFEDAMRTLSSVAKSASGFSFATLEETIRHLGRTTSFTAREIANASVALARGGFDTQEINKSIGSVLDLARATGTDLAIAADIATKVTRAFGLSVSDTSKTMDILTATANGSAQILEDLFESLKLAAPLANQTKRSLADTAAALGVLANAGVKGTLAATALNRATSNFSTLEGQAQLKSFGVRALDLAGNLRPLSDILNDLFEQLRDKGTAEQVSKLIEVLGLRGILASQLGPRIKEFKAFREELNKVDGIARSVAEQIDGGTGGALRRLKSAVEGLAIEIGIALAGPLGMLVEWLTKMTIEISKFISRSGALVAQIAAWTAGSLVFGVALTALGVIFNVIATTMGIVVGLIGTVIGLFTGFVGIVFSLATTIGAAAIALAKFTAGVFLVAGSITGTIVVMGALGATAALVISGIVSSVIVLANTIKSILTNAITGISQAFSRVAKDVMEQVETIKTLFNLGQIDAGVQVITETIKLAFKEAVTEALIQLNKLKVVLAGLKIGDIQVMSDESANKVARIAELQEELANSKGGFFSGDRGRRSEIAKLQGEVDKLEEKLKPIRDLQINTKSLRDEGNKAIEGFKDKINQIKVTAITDDTIARLAAAPKAALEGLVSAAGIKLSRPLKDLITDSVEKNVDTLTKVAGELGTGSPLLAGLVGAIDTFGNKVKEGADLIQEAQQVKLEGILDEAKKIIEDKKRREQVDAAVKKLEGQEQLKEIIARLQGKDIGDSAQKLIGFLGNFALAGQQQQQELQDATKRFSELAFAGDPRVFGGPVKDEVAQKIATQTDVLLAIKTIMGNVEKAVKLIQNPFFGP